jgi:hypothetical protein
MDAWCLAMVVARLFASIVVFVTLAATISEWTTLFGLFVVVVAFEVASARSLINWLIAGYWKYNSKSSMT